MRHRYLLGMLILSGFAGLAYELLWVRILALSFGSTILSFSTVLAVFFGGLSVGAWFSGRRAARIARPARVYALTELATGILGLGLYPILLALGDLFARVDPGTGLAGALVRFAFAAPVLLIPTFLMGATLPLVVAATIRDQEQVGRGTALIYGFNTLGACLGAYVTTFHALPHLGVFNALLLTAGINVVVAGMTLVLERRDIQCPAAEGVAAEEKEKPDEEVRNVARVAVACAFLTGLAAIVFQVVWARFFSTFLEGTVYGLGAVLIAVLVGIAVGSLLISGPLRSSQRTGTWFVATQIVMSLAVILLVSNLDYLGFVLQGVGARQGSTFSVHLQLVIVLIALLPPMVCSGAALPLLVAMLKRQAHRTSHVFGNVYAANTVGSIGGSLLGGFVLLPSSGSEATIYFGLVISVAAAALGTAFFVQTQRPLRLLGAGACLGVLLLYPGLDARRIALPKAEDFEEARRMGDERAERLAFFREGLNANIEVEVTDTTRSLVMNGLGQGARKVVPPYYLFESLLVAMVPLAHVDQPKRAMVVGLGAGITVDALVEFGVKDVTVVELEPSVEDAVRVVFDPLPSPVDRQEVTLHVDDARHFLRRNLAGDEPQRFDLITSMPAHPWVASSIFTQEFFEIAQANLTDEGVFCTWFGLHRGVDEQGILSLLRAFTSVFEHHTVYLIPETSALFMVGSNKAVSMSGIRNRTLQDHAIAAGYPALRDPMYLPRRTYFSNAKKLPAGPVNTDDSAYVEMHVAGTSTASAPPVAGIPGWAVVPPLLVLPDERVAFIADLLETHLGTPGGFLAYGKQRPDLVRARLQLKASEAYLPTSALDYFRGRTLLASGQRAQAYALLDKVAQSTKQPWAERARKHRALASPDAMTKLTQLPQSADVQAYLLHAPDRDKTLSSTVTPQEQPADLAGLLADLENAEQVTRTEWARHGEFLRTLSLAPVFDLCAKRLEALQPDLSRHCRRRALKERESLARGRMRVAWSAAVSGRTQQAEKEFERALQDKADPRAQRDYLRLLVRSGDTARIHAYLETLQFSGASRQSLEYFMRTADEIKAPEPTSSDIAR